MKCCLPSLLLMIIVFYTPALAAPFVSNSNSTVTDQGTGMVWQMDDDNVTRTWQGALDYCNGLTIGGSSDWRLPDIKELSSIVDETRYWPAVAPVFSSTKAAYYWSASSYASNPDNAWVVSFYDGYVYYLSKADSYYVRCVR